jgi:hypothetical protein
MAMRKPRLLSLPAGVRYEALKRFFAMIRADRPRVWHELVDAVRHADKPEEAAAAWLEQKGLMDDGHVALPAACAVLLNDVQDWRLTAVVLHFMKEGFLPAGNQPQFVYTLDLMEFDVRQYPLSIDAMIARAVDDFTAQLRTWLHQCGMTQEMPVDADERLEMLMLHLVDGLKVTDIAYDYTTSDIRHVRRLLAEAEAMTGIMRRTRTRTRTGRPSRK